MDICVKVGRRVRRLRTERGISQIALADQAELTRSNLSRIENGRAEPGIRTLERIARALNVDVRDLFD